ncbi:isoprenylcysteine carboxylmethyltransferase family protein [Defluviitalea saccharophila]|uniref:Isoprenylcysteine carboxylmethyltransferase family protein n=1 Tax=Defluviitalea saccharophila TaxID=879970 RepID=A0ABZ2Y691_9FIRM
MSILQISAIIILILFYGAYLTKLIVQKRKGIQTTQLGIGSKSKKTLLVEKLLKFTSFVIVPIELISILLDTNSFLSEKVRISGIVLAAVGSLVFIIAMVTMRDSWRAGIPAEDNTQMVTSGIYRISRNPAFLGFDLTYIGYYLAFDNLPLLLISLFAVTLMHLQILEEEKYLANRFGTKYLEYKKNVGRYLKIVPF